MLKNHPRIRLAIYLAGTIIAAAAPIIAVAFPDYGQAVTVSAGILLAAVGITAASNTPRIGKHSAG